MDHYFIELKDLVSDKNLAEDLAAQLRSAALPWVTSSPISACLCPGVLDVDLFDYVLINDDYVYFFRMDRNHLEAVSVKGFKASDMVAHALLLPMAPQGAQIRLMLSDGKRIKLILNNDITFLESNVQMMKDLAKSAFFTAK